MAEEIDNKQSAAQARPGQRRGARQRPSGPGKGTGKVTAGHGRSPRASAGRSGASRMRATSGRGGNDSADAPLRGSIQGDGRMAVRGSGSGGERVVPRDSDSDDGAKDVREPSVAGGAGTTRAGGSAGSTRVRDRRRLSEMIGRSTRMQLFLQSSLPDLILVLAVSTALVYTVSYGFYSAENYRGNLLLIGVLCLPMLLVLFAGGWSKKAVAFSAVGAVALIVVYCAVAGVLSPDPALFVDGAVNDVAGNYVIFALVLCVTTIVAYLLSRRTVGLVFLLIAGIVACGFVQHAWPEWALELGGIPAFIAMFLGVGMLFVYQCYRQSVYSANRVKRTSFLGAFGYSALIAAACVLVGVGVFAGIAAIAPDTVVLKPFESHVSPPVDEKANSYERMEAENDETTDRTDDNTEEGSESDTGGDSTGRSGLGFLSGTVIGSAAQALAGYDPDDPNAQYENIDYLILQWEIIILVALVALALLSAVLIQRLRRTLRLRRIAKQSVGYQSWYLYTFLLGRFRRLKLAKPDHLTPLEYAVGFSKPMLPFTRGTGGVDFVDVSSAYQDAVFGSDGASAEALESMKAYYRAFFKNARHYVGLPKWVLWKFWRI